MPPQSWFCGDTTFSSCWGSFLEGWRLFLRWGSSDWWPERARYQLGGRGAQAVLQGPGEPPLPKGMFPGFHLHHQWVTGSENNPKRSSCDWTGQRRENTPCTLLNIPLLLMWKHIQSSTWKPSQNHWGFLTVSGAALRYPAASPQNYFPAVSPVSLITPNASGVWGNTEGGIHWQIAQFSWIWGLLSSGWQVSVRSIAVWICCYTPPSSAFQSWSLAPRGHITSSGLWRLYLAPSSLSWDTFLHSSTSKLSLRKSLLPYPFEVMQLSPRSRCQRDPSAGFSFSSNS